MSDQKINTTNGDWLKNNMETSSIIDSFSPEQKILLLQRYYFENDENANELDSVLKNFSRRDHHLLFKFQGEIQKDTLGKFAGKGAKQIDLELANKSTHLEFKRFWSSDEIQKVESPTANDEKSKKLASYVPKVVLRHLLSGSGKVQAPEMEKFPGSVMFADISGFTPLTEKLSQLGPEGVEKLTHELNKYFDNLTSIIYSWGGDIVKFAGDALLVIWPCATNKGISGMVMLACQCAKELLDSLKDYKVEGTDCTLKLHIGIGAGEIGGVYVGGTNKRYEFFISGDVLEQVSSCEKQANSGECYVSHLAWMLVEKPLQLNGTQKGKGALENYRLDGIKVGLEKPPPVDLTVSSRLDFPLRTFIQAAVLRHIDSGSSTFLAELRQVSVIFVNLTKPFKEKELFELQDGIKQMQEVIYHFEGTVRQFMIDDKGSVFIAGFGLPPHAHEDDAIRAVESALAIHQKLENLKLPHSIGVTTGKTFCGNVGSERRREYAMVGDIVNLSARLMAAAKTGILVDSDTYEAAKNAAIAFHKQKPIRVKGKTEEITTYIPEKMKKKMDHQKARTRIIGREIELDKLQGVINEMHIVPSEPLPSTQIVILEGEAGVGKTILMNELEASFREMGQLIFAGHGDQLKTTTAFYAFQDILETVVENGKLIPRVEKALAREGKQKLIPLLKSVLPLSEVTEDDELMAMSGQQKSQSIQLLLVQILKVLIEPGSIILLDNAHWLDSSSWAIAVAVAQQINHVLMVFSLRPMTEKNASEKYHYSQLLHQQNTIHIQLENLSHDDTSELVAQCLNIKSVPIKITKEIYRKSNGNPFLTEEIVYALQSSGGLQITKAGQCIMTSENVMQSLPPGLKGLITNKVDKLTPQQQTALKVASVIGQEFEVKMAYEILRSQADIVGPSISLTSVQDLKKELREIESLGLIGLETPDPDATYSFSNSLIADVVYELMLFAQRRKIHSAIIEYYLKHYEGKKQYYPLLAHHYQQASDNPQSEEMKYALDYYTKAGSSCLNNYSNTEAVSFFKEAISIIEQRDQSFTLEGISMHRKQGQSYYNLGQFEKAEEHFRKALDLMGLATKKANFAKDLQNLLKKKPDSITFIAPLKKKEKDKEAMIMQNERPHRKVQAVISLLALAKIYFYGNNRTTSGLCANLALHLSDNTGPSFEGEAQAICGLIAGLNGNHETAEAFLEKGRSIASNQLDVLKTLEQIAAIYYCGICEWNKAKESLHKTIEAAKTVGDLKVYEEATLSLGTCFYLTGEVEKSVSLTQEALESATQRGDAQNQIIATNIQARNFYTLGEFSKCYNLLDEIRVAFDTVGRGDMAAAINYYALCSLVNFRNGDVKDSWVFAEACSNLMSRIEHTSFEMFLGFGWLIESYLKLFENQKSWNEVSPPLSKAKVTQKIKVSFSNFKKFCAAFPFALTRYYLWRGLYFHFNGKKDKAKTRMSEAKQIAEKYSMKYEEALVRYHLGKVQNSTTEKEEATKMFRHINTLDEEIQLKRKCIQSKSLSKMELVRNGGSLTSPVRSLRGSNNKDAEDVLSPDSSSSIDNE